MIALILPTGATKISEVRITIEDELKKLVIRRVWRHTLLDAKLLHHIWLTGMCGIPKIAIYQSRICALYDSIEQLRSQSKGMCASCARTLFAISMQTEAD